MSDPDTPTAVVVSVEDNPADVRLLEEGVAAVDADIDLRVYNNGRTAVERLVNGENVVDEPVGLVLLDLNIPGKSGLEILRELRGDSAFDGAPIVVVSSSTNPEDIRRVYEATANAYLTKPSDPDEFIRTIAAAVQFWIDASTGASTNE